MHARRVINALVFVALVGGVGYFALTHQDRVLQAARQIEARFLPCRSPITYSLGTIDARFGISKVTLIANLKEAEDIREKYSDKDLFEYKSDGGDVVVNFVYDYRQQARDKMAAESLRIDK